MSDISSKINRICRVCLEERDTMLSIYESKSAECSKCISNLIMECTAVKVHKGDGLPSQMCADCYARLEKAYLFKKDCERSDNTLRQCIGNSDIKDEEMINRKYEVDELIQQYASSNGSLSSDPLNVCSMVKIEMEDGENDDLQFSQNSDYTGTSSFLDNQSSTVTSQETLDCTRGEFSCPGCQKQFDIKSNLIAHFWQHHSPEKNQNVDSLEISKRVLKQELKFDTVFEKLKPIKRKRRKCKSSHKIKTRGKSIKYNICYVCCKNFNSKTEYEEHKDNHSTQKHICEDCDIEFDDYLALALHKKVHFVENNFTCLKCECAFNCQKKLDYHFIQNHINNETHGCIICLKTFEEESDLSAHMKAHSNHKCSFCDKTFTTSLRLSNHLRVHTKDKPFTCEECGKNFSQKCNLDKHINSVHKGVKSGKREKKHLCPHCGQTFFRPVDLTIHIRTHTGFKPFSCQQCEYRCHDKQLLKSHMRKHSGLRPYKCSYCVKAFNSRSYLTIHERFHSGFRPYICSQCQKGFTNSKDLKVHERTHTGIKLFTCNVCSNSFTTLHYLRVHMKKHD